MLVCGTLVLKLRSKLRVTWIAQRFYRPRETFRRQPLNLERRIIAPEERSRAAHEVAVGCLNAHHSGQGLLPAIRHSIDGSAELNGPK